MLPKIFCVRMCNVTPNQRSRVRRESAVRGGGPAEPFGQRALRMSWTWESLLNGLAICRFRD